MSDVQRAVLPMPDQVTWGLTTSVGALASGKGDVAARSQEILREKIGPNAR